MRVATGNTAATRWRRVRLLVAAGVFAGLLVPAAKLSRDSRVGQPISPRTVSRAGLEQESRSPVLAGMQVAVQSLRRDGDMLTITYTFRWVEDPSGLPFRFMRAWGGINLYFWDAAGHRMKTVICERYVLPPAFLERKLDTNPDSIIFSPAEALPPAFLERKLDTFEGTARVELPPGARSFALELGRSEIVTHRVPIP